MVESTQTNFEGKLEQRETWECQHVRYASLGYFPPSHAGGLRWNFGFVYRASSSYSEFIIRRIIIHTTWPPALRVVELEVRVLLEACLQVSQTPIVPVKLEIDKQVNKNLFSAMWEHLQLSKQQKRLFREYLNRTLINYSRFETLQSLQFRRPHHLCLYSDRKIVEEPSDTELV